MIDSQSDGSTDRITELANDLGSQLQRLGWQITTAESCTGGLIAGAITDIAGSSDWFRNNADLAVAVSGVAGPGGGSIDKPVGLVWIAWALDGRVESECFQYPGDRSQVRSQAVVSALHGSIERLQRI